ncbi:MAG: CBS domain-containing protein [Chloroflexi bacterium]|nr:CBS domain-containing protein [Chloroflexota bacterium]
MANYALTAGDIMQKEVETILGDLSVQEAVTQMHLAGIRSLLVVPREEAEPYGIISYSDVVYDVLASQKDPRRVTVDEISTTPAIAVRPTDTIQHVSAVLRKHRIGHVPVVDEQERLIGIISMTDLVTEVIVAVR